MADLCLLVTCGSIHNTAAFRENDKTLLVEFRAEMAHSCLANLDGSVGKQLYKQLKTIKIYKNNIWNIPKKFDYCSNPHQLALGRLTQMAVVLMARDFVGSVQMLR